MTKYLQFFALSSLLIIISCNTVKGTEVIAFDKIIVRQAKMIDTVEVAKETTPETQTEEKMEIERVVDITAFLKETGFFSLSQMRRKVVTPQCATVAAPNTTKRAIVVKYEKYNRDDYERKTKTYSCNI